MAEKKQMRLGDLLVESGLITEDQLQEALRDKKSGQKLGDVLIQKGFITELQLVEVLEFQLGIPHVTLYNYPFDESLIKLVPKDFAKRNLVIPIRKEGNKLYVAMSDPMDYFVINDLRLSTGFIIEPVIATRDDIIQSIAKYYDKEDFSQKFGFNMEDLQEEESLVENEDSPIVKLVNQIIQQAVVQHASDIHIDPQNHQVLVRYRVDGDLKTEQVLPKNIQASLITRIKIMANMDITEQRIPLDGRIKKKIDTQEVDLRISTMPTIFGEKIVIRIFDLNMVTSDISKLGFREDNLNHFMTLIKKPYGIVLVTGPTGSGKSTTMYSALNYLNNEKANIITIEDPVEFQINGINQIQINPSVGLTFARGLRSILRQDPNIIMVGEIRDQETANMAVRASITGHLVFSTIHANDSIGTLMRLKNMGIELFLIGTSLNGVVSQRLVRKVCRDCQRKEAASEREKTIFARHGMEIDYVYRGTGCPTCNMTGYRGRTAIHEVLVIDEELRDAIINDANTTELKRIAVNNGFKYLIEDGLQKVKDGVTTTEEILHAAME